MKFLIYFTLAMIVLSSIVYAGFTYSNEVPVDGATLDSRNVNYSWTVSITDLNLTDGGGVNCSIVRNLSVLFGPVNLTNDTFYNQTIVSQNGVYEWYASCEDNESINIVNTSKFVFTVAEAVPDTFTYELLAQDAYAILTDADVNYSFTVNVTGGVIESGDNVTCDILTRNGSASTFDHTSSIVISNASFFNETITMPEGRTGWKVNCSTDFHVGAGSGESTSRFLDVDTNYYNLAFGVGELINFTLDTGNIDTAGTINALNFSTSPACAEGEVLVQTGDELACGIGAVEPNQTFILSSGSTSLTGDDFYFGPGYASATESNAQVLWPVNIIISDMYCRLGAAGASDIANFTFRVNGTNVEDLSCLTITALPGCNATSQAYSLSAKSEIAIDFEEIGGTTSDNGNCMFVYTNG